MSTCSQRGFTDRRWFTIVSAIVFYLIANFSLHAQTYTVLHNFTNGQDGGGPSAGLTMDGAGNLYGTTIQGGNLQSCQYGCGTVFKMSRRNSAWIFTPLYAFLGASDGATPASRLTIGANGTLYGTTGYGGSSIGITGSGVVFNLQPPAHFVGNTLGGWNETVLYTFGGPPDGANPSGDIVFDAQGNLYGTTFNGGVDCDGDYYCGIVFELTPHAGQWTETILYSFTQRADSQPLGVTIDANGNLYGMTVNYNGAVFRLMPSGTGWIETTLYHFMGQPDAGVPDGDLIFDPAGNLYGTTVYGGINNDGAVFELSPQGSGWTESVIASLDGNDGSQPMAGLARDAAGNLYGTTCYGGTTGRGTVFKLTPSGGSWTETTLHEFSGQDGNCPMGNLLLDASGNMYGTTADGGLYAVGVAFEITP